MALKPDKLSFDTNLGTVRRWKQRFRAFHASSNLRVLPLADQQAFLIACIDDEVANRINRLVAETTPMLPNNANMPCCFDIIDSLFREKIPLLLRCVQFMSNKQQEGQDGISWREELRNLSDDAAIKEMQSPDLLCVIYVTGIRNNELREKLLEISNPTLKNFNRMVDSFDQAKRELEEMKRPATSAATHQAPRRQRNETISQRSNTNRRPEIPIEELERRKQLAINATDVARKTTSYQTALDHPITAAATVGNRVMFALLASKKQQTTPQPDQMKTINIWQTRWPQ